MGRGWVRREASPLCPPASSAGSTRLSRTHPLPLPAKEGCVAMKFTLSWLKEHVETDASAAEVAETLTRIGLEVESVDNPAEKLAPFTIAKVLSAAPHPQADKLQVLSVDT